mmetsp:Transcript_18791/g.43728  ORF Transcript_18791/g.43728 Transcript_18791/m.43728 type:complete len:112 (-) Transcript_18791:100-435(-)
MDLDESGIFAEPVPDDVPDYDGHLALIGTERMDLGTMKKQSRRYKSVAALRDDLTMMLRNCMTYNEPDSIFFAVAEMIAVQAPAIAASAIAKFGGAAATSSGGRSKKRARR